jgi:hypothetical protein
MCLPGRARRWKGTAVRGHRWSRTHCLHPPTGFLKSPLNHQCNWHRPRDGVGGIALQLRLNPSENSLLTFHCQLSPSRACPCTGQYCPGIGSIPERIRWQSAPPSTARHTGCCCGRLLMQAPKQPASSRANMKGEWTATIKTAQGKAFGCVKPMTYFASSA